MKMPKPHNPDHVFTCTWCGRTYYYGPRDGHQAYCNAECRHKEHQHALAEIKKKFSLDKPK